ncbi:hypothetical protein O4J56_07715 [Nocardiopsis sp. RSe5-2]|uniref:Uncharacterized protein n=1 Tax=Nocardiopsis endophytica TaxID=3018445 RepID=A0ABT4U0P2_9ACTN|nr:type III-B CRISPR module-associated Cmr3 family protein [Nocardiopsis endophytica]MDA2810521.1 hypothetical protein [Nocardiopsis endophytica]
MRTTPATASGPEDDREPQAGPPTWAVIEPHDTVQVRDGRRFEAGDDGAGVAETVAPGPSTVAGALGWAHDGELAYVRGPVVARRDRQDGPWQPHFPVPLDVVADAGGRSAYRLEPGADSSASDLRTMGSDAPAPRRLLQEPARAWGGQPIEELIHAHALGSYLRGELFPAPGEPVPLGRLETAAEPPWAAEPRIGLARRGRQVRIGYLYQATHLRPRPGWALLAQTAAPGGRPLHLKSPVPFGGQTRMADVTTEAAPAGPNGVWPQRPEEFPQDRLLLYVATPALWPEGWCPPLPEEASLVAAAVGAPMPVATASSGRGFGATRMLRWAVPPGSVYWLQLPPGTAAAFAARWHNRPLTPAADWTADHPGGTPCPPGKAALHSAGFGIVLTGVWK